MPANGGIMESEKHFGMHPLERPGFLNPKFIQWVESLPLQTEDGLWFQDHIRGLKRKNPGDREKGKA